MVAVVALGWCGRRLIFLRSHRRQREYQAGGGAILYDIYLPNTVLQVIQEGRSARGAYLFR